MQRFRSIRVAVSGAILAGALASAPVVSAGDEVSSAPDRVPNFIFTDVGGVKHELYDYSDAKAVVLFFQINGCPIVRQSYPYFEEIKQRYEDKGVVFLYINSNKWDTSESVVSEQKDYEFTPPVLVDPYRALAHYLHVERSADTFVVEPGQDWRIVYHGMADDRFDYGLQRMSPKKFWLREALDAILAGNEPAHSETVAKGCLLDMDTYQGVDFSKHVKPVLESDLAAIFSNGVKSEASAMRAKPDILSALLTHTLPDGQHVEFKNDDAEILVAWLFGPTDTSD